MKTTWRNRLPTSLVAMGSLISLTCLFALDAGVDTRTYGIAAGIALSLCSVLPIWKPKSISHAQNSDDALEQLQQERASLEEWKQAQVELLRLESERIKEQQRSLINQFAQVQEFLEYPVIGAAHKESHDAAVRLSEQDRQVHVVLETEAARVYEKIRANGYTKNGNVDIAAIRSEVYELILKVAHIYSPGSTNPLLETSFEQLARSASRVCLHALVLLEQLPLDVKSYNIREMYGYIRKAVQGYGTYQQVAPWLKHLTRGAYVGRLAAGTNPVSLGAWWVATEVGRRGAQKFVENVVDRQAVAALNDIVTIIGVEVANVYGSGFRQRDASWVYGSEVTELLHRFPVSRDALQRGLREITALPLRSEYDRIYLYRCIAEHRSAGLRISDPAILTRDEREQVAVQLEEFFRGAIHGVTEADRLRWQQDVESRLDLRLKLSEKTAAASPENAAEAVRAVHAFLVSIAGADTAAATRFLELHDLMNHVPVQQRASLLTSLSESGSEVRFAPPDLDPACKVTEAFLEAMMNGSVVTGTPDENVDELLVETACYFRRSREEAVALLDGVLRTHIQNRCQGDVSLKKVESSQLRVLLTDLQSSEWIVAVYDGLQVQRDGKTEPLDDAVLWVLKASAADAVRCVLTTSSEVLWTSVQNITVERDKGFLIDDCRITGGTWQSSAVPPADSISISGSVTGGGYQKYFASLATLDK